MLFQKPVSGRTISFPCGLWNSVRCQHYRPEGLLKGNPGFFRRNGHQGRCYRGDTTGNATDVASPSVSWRSGNGAGVRLKSDNLHRVLCGHPHAGYDKFDALACDAKEQEQQLNVVHKAKDSTNRRSTVRRPRSSPSSWYFLFGSII
uniref:(northern house mosquito) hypothetical protein n=1 Tax=Culex pipiens TaxID=7175 RepID=A0A8D8FYR2_CULPI